MLGGGPTPPLARVHGTVRSDGIPQEAIGLMEELRGDPLPLLRGVGGGLAFRKRGGEWGSPLFMSGGNPPRRNLRELPVIVGSLQETVAEWVEPRGYPILSAQGGGGTFG